jgi:glycosyltransferase involved in cell wall biosynthesis
MKISIIIPHKDDLPSLKLLLLNLNNDLYRNCEILIIDSSACSILPALKEIERSTHTQIRVLEGNNYYPGYARNFGAKNAEGEIICFLDAKTIPTENWLSDGLLLLSEQGNDMVVGKFQSRESSFFGKIVKAATFGNLPHSCLPGTITYKKIFLASGGFHPSTRAGEDIDWLYRMKHLGFTIKKPQDVNLIYSGLPTSLLGVIKKWYLYSMENAKVNILIGQKSIYFFLLLIFFLYLSYRWNYISTGGAWDRSPYFIPHLNTILWSIMGISYITFRSLILPLKRKEKITFLLPINFIYIGAVSFIIDLVKIPGRIYGFVKIFTYTDRI